MKNDEFKAFLIGAAVGAMLVKLFNVDVMSAVLQYSKNHTDTDTDNKKNKKKVSKKPKNR